MTKDEYICEHIDNNSEFLKRLAIIIGVSFPYLESEISNLIEEWASHSRDIRSEYEGM